MKTLSDYEKEINDNLKDITFTFNDVIDFLKICRRELDNSVRISIKIKEDGTAVAKLYCKGLDIIVDDE